MDGEAYPFQITRRNSIETIEDLRLYTKHAELLRTIRLASDNPFFEIHTPKRTSLLGRSIFRLAHPWEVSNAWTKTPLYTSKA